MFKPLCYLSLFLGILIPTGMMSQETNAKFSFGTEFGYEKGFHKHEASELFAFDGSNTLNGGVFLHADYAKRFALQIGIAISYFSFNQTDYSVAFPADHNGAGGFNQLNSFIRSDLGVVYLGPTVTHRFYISDAKNLFVEVGAQAKYNVKQVNENVLVSGGNESPFEYDFNIYETSNVLADINAGIGYDLKFESIGSLYVKSNISYGLNKTFNPIGDNEPDFIINSRKVGISATIGLRFGAN